MSQSRREESVPVSLLESLIDDAEFALEVSDVSTGVSRLEALLSSARKILLRHAPQDIRGDRTLTRETENASVLIVEDDWMFQKGLKALLDSHGIRAGTVSSAELALRAMVKNSFNALWIDINLGRFLDGLYLAKAAKKIDPGVKIIICSGYMHQVGIHDKELTQCVDAWLQNPLLVRRC